MSLCINLIVILLYYTSRHIIICDTIVYAYRMKLYPSCYSFMYNIFTFSVRTWTHHNTSYIHFIQLEHTHLLPRSELLHAYEKEKNPSHPTFHRKIFTESITFNVWKSSQSPNIFPAVKFPNTKWPLQVMHKVFLFSYSFIEVAKLTEIVDVRAKSSSKYKTFRGHFIV